MNSPFKLCSRAYSKRKFEREIYKGHCASWPHLQLQRSTSCNIEVSGTCALICSRSNNGARCKCSHCKSAAVTVAHELTL